MNGDGVRVCLTFDHLGAAADVGRGRAVVPDPRRADLTHGFPRLLDLLDEVGAPATFFCEGWSALHHTRAVDALLSRGHEVGLHGWVHEPWSRLGTDERRRILHDGAAALRNAGVARPGFRAPGGVAGAGDAALLAEVGIAEDSSLRPDAGPEPREIGDGVVTVPFVWPAVDYWAYELNPADPATPADLPGRWRTLLDEARARPDRLLVLVLHPGCSGTPDDRFAAAREFVRHVADEPDVGFRTIRSIADELRPAPPSPPDAGRPAWFTGIDVPAGPPEPGARPAAWRSYLNERGLVPLDAGPCTPLPRGVSGEVCRVGEVVVKRPHPMLAVDDDWHAGTTRVLAEGAAMRAATGLAPRVLHVDERHRVLVQSFAAGHPWKEELLAGQVDVRVAELLAGSLQTLRSLSGPEGAARLRRLRLEPYFGVAARRIPELAGELHAVRDRLAAARLGLVHGDLSPKNVLVDRSGDGPRITILDWEVAHQGDPVLDLAFLLCHLYAKRIAVPGVDVGPAARVLRAPAPDIDEGWLRRVTGALLVARAHGSSRLEYLDEQGRVALTTTGAALLRTAAWPDPERRLW